MKEKDLLSAKLKYIEINKELIHNNQEIISLYHDYIYKVIELFDYLINNEDDLFYTIFFDILLNSGFFSLNSKINKNNQKKQEITTHFGINVLTGDCCCRNIASFYEDISSHFFLYPLLLTCLDDQKVMNDKELAYGNHQVNLTRYQDKIYLYDLSNSLLFYPKHKDVFKGFNNNSFLYWKKYTDIIFRFYKETTLKNNYFEEIKIKQRLFKDSLKKPLITVDDYKKLLFKAYDLINKKNYLLTSFYQETNHYKDDINHQLIKKSM